MGSGGGGLGQRIFRDMRLRTERPISPRTWGGGSGSGMGRLKTESSNWS